MKKLTLSLLLVVVFSVIGLSWVISNIYYHIDGNNNALSGKLNTLKEVGLHLANTLNKMGDKDRKHFVAQWQEGNTIALLDIQTKSGFPIPKELAPSFENGGPLVLESDGDVSLHYYLKSSDQVMGLVIPKVPQSRSNSTLNLVLTLIFYLGVVAIILLWLYPLIRRLAILRSTAKAFGQGDLSSRVTRGRISYIADIELEFNRMADRIQTLVSDNKMLSRAVSHDLKTPLARLRFGIDTLAETEDRSAREKYTQRISRDLCEMESLVNTLLQYAKLDESNFQLHLQDVNLTSFVQSWLESVDGLGINIEYDFSDKETTIQADKRYLLMQLNNLISNALNHTKSLIKVTVKSTNGYINLCIEDDGIGIPSKDLDQVVKPFWRGSTSVNNDGHGMGLAIVAKIADWHKTKITITKSESLGGASISLDYTPASTS